MTGVNNVQFGGSGLLRRMVAGALKPGEEKKALIVAASRGMRNLPGNLTDSALVREAGDQVLLRMKQTPRGPKKEFLMSARKGLAAILRG